MDDLQVVEYKDIRVLTTQQLAGVYGTESQVIANNFNRNKERYAEGKHYICLTGEEKAEFIKKNQNDFSSFTRAKAIYLWTEKGALLHAKSLNTDTAWEVYSKLVETYFHAKRQTIDRSQLSPQMQLIYAMADGQAKIELEQKRQAQEITEVKQTVQNIKKELTEPIGDWRAEINTKVREIAIKSNMDYQDLFAQMYGELEQTAHCSLKRLCDNKRDRMEKAGNTKTCIENETTKIAIIEGKPQLKAIFESIVRRYAMAYCA